MNRRGFLRLLGGAVAVAAAPAKTYAFFGDILRPKRDLWFINERALSLIVNPPIYAPKLEVMVDWRHCVRIANIDVSELQADPRNLFDLMVEAHAEVEREIKEKGLRAYVGFKKT